MSKLLLKKEIKSLTREQLEQMILDAYDARKEIKAYFDFFLTPDVDKLIDKYKISISKELSRSKRGYSKARISTIKKLLKEFASFQPGFEAELDLMLFTISFALLVEKSMHFTDTLINGISLLTIQMLDLADLNCVADKTIIRLTTTLDNDLHGSKYFRRHLRHLLETYTPPTATLLPSH